MLNLVKVELIKVRRYKGVYICLFPTALISLLSLFPNMDFIQAGGELPMFTNILVFNAALMVCSGIALTLLMQREYQDNTIINTLTVPVDRKAYILSKTITWLLWHLLALMIYAGSTILFFVNFSSLSSDFLAALFLDMIRLGLISFISLLPLLLIAVKQKKSFFGTVAFTLLFAVLTIAFSNGLIAYLVPWISVTEVGISELQTMVGLRSVIMRLVSILAVGFISLVWACRTFAKQDQ